VALMGVPLGADAQQGRAGTIYDAESGAPLGAASIGLRHGADARIGRWLETDGGGRFVVPAATDSVTSIEVRALGHRGRVLSVAETEALGWRIGLDPDPLELESVVVTAVGRTQRRADVAVSVARVSAEEIRTSGATSAQTLLAEIPGLQATGVAPVGSNIMIRGIGDARVLVLLDGQPAGGALLENRDLSRMSLAGVERVEVVKGPLSSQYGSDALGGVINIITREPDAGLRGDARVMAGDAGRREAAATLSGGGDVRYRVTGSWRQEDQVPGLDRSLHVFARVWDVRSTTRYDGGGPLRARADFSFVRERQRWPVGGGFSGFNDNRGLTGWIETSLDHGPGSWVARAFGQDYYHLYRSARGDTPIAGSADLQEESLWKASLGYSATLGAHAVDVGVEGSRREISSPDKILEDRASDSQIEVFAGDAWSLGEATLTTGARLTLNDRWGNTVSPSIGVSLPLSEALLWRASVGRGFRAPSFKELAWDFANVGGGYTIQGFAGLEPERSWSASVAMEWAPAANVGLTAEAYTNEIDNLIEFAFVGNSGGGLTIYSPRNVRRARTRGVELTGTARSAWARIGAEYAYLDARSLDDDMPLDRRAAHTGRLRLGADAPLLSGLRFDLSANVTGSAPVLGTDAGGQTTEIDTQELLFSLDGQLGIEVRRGVHLSVGADNLLDSQPAGWQGVVTRRLRLGLEARDLF